MLNRIFRYSTFILTTLVFVGCSSIHGSQRVSLPPEGVETVSSPDNIYAPEYVRSFRDRIEIGVSFDDLRRDMGSQGWVLAVPLGELTTELVSLELEDIQSADRIVLSGDEADTHFEALVESKALKVEAMGVVRHARLARLRIDPSKHIQIEKPRYRIHSLEAVISFPKYRAPVISDSGFTDESSPIRGSLNTIVSNPEAIDAYAIEDVVLWNKLDHAPSEWQPLSEDSVDLCWRRIVIDRDDVYAIDGRWLSEAGLDASKIEPDSLVLYRHGKQIPLFRIGAEERGFDQGARLIFYGEENDSPETKESVYYLGRQVESINDVAGDAPEFDQQSPTIRTYNRSIVVEEDNELKTKVGNFLSIREMTWVWQKLLPNQKAILDFDVQGLSAPIPAAEARVHLYYAGGGKEPSAEFEFVVNGQTIEQPEAKRARDLVRSVVIPEGLLNRGSNTLEITVVLEGESVPPAFQALYLDKVELVYESLVTEENNRHRLVPIGSDGIETGVVNVAAVGFRADRLLALDVRNPEAPIRLNTEVGDGDVMVAAHWTEDTDLLLVEFDRIERAPSPQVSSWEDWRRENQSADGVIITHSDFAAHAEQLAKTWRDAGHETIVVDVDQLYEAYTYGELSASAIQLFLRDAITRWEGRRPSKALLIGDTTSDGRNDARNDVRNFVPSYQVPPGTDQLSDEYASEGFFQWLVGEDELSDIVLGRLPFANQEDAKIVVQKIERYGETLPGEWAGDILSVSDPNGFETVLDKLDRSGVDAWLNHQRLAASDQPWEDNYFLPKAVMANREIKVSPYTTRQIDEAWNAGLGLILFVGHGSPNIWSNQRIWFGGQSKNSDNTRLRNGAKLPFLIALTCNNGAIDYPMPPWNINITEDMLRTEQGGIIGGFLPTGPGFSRNHVRLAEAFYRVLASEDRGTFGEVVEATRLLYQANVDVDDHSRMYLLMGDPTLDFLIPKNDLRIKVDRPVWPMSGESHSLNLQVSHDDPLVSGTVKLRGDGRTLAAFDLANGESGALNGMVTERLEPWVDNLQLFVRAWTTAGEIHQGGVVLEREPGQVRIVRADIMQANDVDEARYTLRNESRFATTCEFRTTYRTADGPVFISEQSFDIEAGESVLAKVPLNLPAGSHLIDAQIYPEHQEAIRSVLPSTRVAQAVVIDGGRNTVDLAFPSGAFEVIPAHSRTGKPVIRTWITNQGSEQTKAKLTWEATYKNGSTATGERYVGTLQPSVTRHVDISLDLELEMKTDLQVSISSHVEEATDSVPDNNFLSAQVMADELADLRFVSRSLEVSPAHLTEGVTVFVDGMVENRGGVASFPVKVELFAEDDENFKVPLRTLAGHPQQRIPSLQPGDRWPFRIRWDPKKNRDVDLVRVRIDGEQKQLEGNQENNVADLPIRIYSPWNLVARGIRVERGDFPGTVKLIASVGNSGETDAEQVSVWFYADEAQTDESFLKEIIVPRVPAGITTEVPFNWDVRNVEDPNALAKPSFSIALKGSLQRVSSAAD